MDTGILTEKVGPFPVIVWGGVAGLAVVAYIYVSGKKGATVTPASTGGVVDTTGTGTAVATAPIDTGYVPSGAMTSSYASTPLAGAPAATNASWLSQAIQSLMSGGATPLDAQTALQDYLSGGTLSTSEQALVNKALTTNGPAPEGTVTPSLPSTPVQPNWADKNTYASFYHMTNGKIIGVTPSGQEHWVSWDEWLAMGAPSNMIIADNVNRSVWDQIGTYASFYQVNGVIHGVSTSGVDHVLTTSEWQNVGSPFDRLVQK